MTVDHTLYYARPAQTTPELPDWTGEGATKLKGPQVVVSALFIYTLIGSSCFTVSMIKVNKIN